MAFPASTTTRCSTPCTMRGAPCACSMPGTSRLGHTWRTVLATGRPQAYVAVPGPGILNTAAALLTAWGMGAPVLALAGQIPGWPRSAHALRRSLRRGCGRRSPWVRPRWSMCRWARCPASGTLSRCHGSGGRRGGHCCREKDGKLPPANRSAFPSIRAPSPRGAWRRGGPGAESPPAALSNWLTPEVASRRPLSWARAGNAMQGRAARNAAQHRRIPSLKPAAPVPVHDAAVTAARVSLLCAASSTPPGPGLRHRRRLRAPAATGRLGAHASTACGLARPMQGCGGGQVPL